MAQKIKSNQFLFDGCDLSKSAPQSLTNATITALTFDVELLDTNAYHGVTNTSRITVTSAGIYLFRGNVSFSSSSSAGSRAAWFAKNASTSDRLGYAATPAAAGLDTGLVISAVLSLAANDYVEVYTYQTSGAALNVNADAQQPGNTRFSCIRLGA